MLNVVPLLQMSLQFIFLLGIVFAVVAVILGVTRR